MWQDMGLYWAWRGPEIIPPSSPPTTKRIRYATITNAQVVQRLAVSVFDDNIERKINRDELASHIKHGATVIYQ